MFDLFQNAEDILQEVEKKQSINATPKEEDDETNYDIEDSAEAQEEDPKVKNVDTQNTDYDIADDEDLPGGEEDTGTEDDTSEDDTGEEAPDDDTQNTDYDIEDGEEGTGEDDGSEEDTEDMPEEGTEQENSEEKSLKPENLFGNYELLYKGINDLAQQVNQISVRSDSEVDIIDRVLNSLRKLEEMVYDYMRKVYDSKSYSQNLTNLHEFQAVLEINVRLIQQISQNRESEDKTSN